MVSTWLPRLRLLLAASARLAVCAPPGPAARAAKPPATELTAGHSAELSAGFVPGELLLAFKPGVSAAETRRVFRQYGLLEQGGLTAARGEDGARLVRLQPQQTGLMARLLRADPRVRYAELNYTLRTALAPNDQRFTQQWGLHNTGQTAGTAGADIDAMAAWDVTTGSHEVIVAVIDTGVNYLHGDLAPNMWKNPGEVPGNKADDDGNGYVDDVHGVNVIAGTGDPMDDNGHGTHVAGILGAAGNNQTGVSGVAWKVRIAACKFLDRNGIGSIADATRCFDYFNQLRQRGVKIVLTNNSWYGFGYSQALSDAMAGLGQAGMPAMLHAAAAGNRGGDNDASPVYPANFDLAHIISVAATTNTDRYAGFSDWGATTVDIAAPGAGILSTYWPGSTYTTLSGTSMATPFVSGAAVLAWALAPESSALEVKDRILSSADAIGGLEGKQGRPTATNGRLNAHRALAQDRTPPTRVTDLAVVKTTLRSATLTWAAPGAGTPGFPPAAYELRYSTTPITPETWENATVAGGLPAPKPAGSQEEVTVRGLAPFTVYSFAIASRDAAGGQSAISPSVQGATESGQSLFHDDMESGAPGWTSQGQRSLWHLSKRSARTPATAWYYGSEATGDYSTPGSANSGALTSPPINLMGASEGILTFWERSVLEPFRGFDSTRVQASTDGTHWTTVAESHGTGGAWVPRSVDVSAYAGSMLQVRFVFDTVDAFSNQYEGWYVDDVAVTGVTRLAVTTASLPDPVVGEHYAQQLTAAGGTAPYAWRLAGGQLPPGLALDGQTGAIRGTPAAAGLYEFTAAVTDGAGGKASMALTLAPFRPLVLTAGALPAGESGTPYSYALEARGGTPPLAWSVVQGALPKGLSLRPDTDIISVTPTTTGEHRTSIRVTDASPKAQSAAGEFTIVIARAPGVATDALPGGTVGVPYARDLAGTGGQPPYAWTVIAGGLPPGLILHAGGALAGTPTSAGTYPFTVQLTDSGVPMKKATKGLTIRVSAAPLSIVTTALPAGALRQHYSQTLLAQGGAAPYAWSLASGDLPPGLSLEGATGRISGVTTSGGPYFFIARVRDSSGTAAAYRPYTLSIAKPLSVTTETLGPGTKGVAYAHRLKGSGGAAPFVWSLASGALPPGLVLDPAGLISGAPAAAGAFPITVRLADRSNPPAVATRELVLEVTQPLAVVSGQLPKGRANSPYSAQLKGAGGSGPYAWKVISGGLPMGLRLDPATGAISGTPRTAGSHAFTIRVTDAASPPRTLRQSITVVIGPPD